MEDNDASNTAILNYDKLTKNTSILKAAEDNINKEISIQPNKSEPNADSEHKEISIEPLSVNKWSQRISSLLNPNKTDADTMVIYRILPSVKSAVYYWRTYSKIFENENISMWTCYNSQCESLSTCKASVRLETKQSNFKVLELGKHTCEGWLSIQKIEKQNSSGTAYSCKEAISHGLHAPKLFQSPEAIIVEGINMNQNFNNSDLPKLVYIGKSLNQVENIMREDKSKIEKFFNKVNVLHLSEIVYDLDFNNASYILFYKNDLKLAYYNGYTYRQYSSYTDANGNFITQYGCNASGNCFAELRIAQDTSSTAYVLRFEHHTCLMYNSSTNDKNVYVTCNLLKLFRPEVNSKVALYFHGYVYKFLFTCDQRKSYNKSNKKDHIPQQKYICSSLENNCPAYLLFTIKGGFRNIFKIGKHICEDKPLEGDEDISIIDNKDGINLMDKSIIEETHCFSTSNYKEEVEQNDIKKLLEGSIEINQEICHLEIGLNKSNDDLDNIDGEIQNSNFINFCVKSDEDEEVSESVEYCQNADEFKERTGDSFVNHVSKTKLLKQTPTKEDRSEERSKPWAITDVKHVSESKPLENVHVDEHTSMDIHSDKNKTYYITSEPTTNIQRYTWKGTIAVKIKNLGYVMGDMPDVDPNDRTTVYLFMSSNIMSNRKIVNYMGYNYYRTRSRCRYKCWEMNCPARLRLKDNRVAVLGPHSCRSPTNLKLNSNNIDDSNDVKCKLKTNLYLKRLTARNTINTSLETSEAKCVQVNITKEQDVNADITSELNSDSDPLLLDRIKQEESIDIIENCVVKTEIKMESEEPNASAVKKEPLGSNGYVEAFIDMTQDEESDVDLCHENATKKSKSLRQKKKKNQVISKADLARINYNKAAIKSNVYLSLTDKKKEDNIDALKHCVGKAAIKLESDKSDGNAVNEEICIVRENLSYGIVQDKDFIDITLDEETSSNVNTDVDQCEQNFKASVGKDGQNTTDSSDNVMHYDNILVAYKGYEYHKELSGKYAWCTNAKICSAMIKILPNNKGVLLGRHICNTFESKTATIKASDVYQDHINDKNENTVHVKIKTISNIPREMKSVERPSDQSDYTMTSGQNLQYKGYRFKKCWESGDIATFTCVHEDTLECPGMLQKFQEKIVRFRDHLCEDSKNVSFPTTRRNRFCVFIYQNKQTSKPEAMYKGFTYKRMLRTSHVSVWVCTNNNCTAGIKIFTFTSTLSENGQHVCIPKSTKYTNQDSAVKKSCKEKTSSNFLLPVYANKSIIPVYNDKDEINLIYQDYIYRGGGLDWTCIYLRSKGCKGFLRILNGHVMHVCRHDCFINTNSNKTCRSAGSLLQTKHSNYTEFLSNISTASNQSAEDRTKDLHVLKGGCKKEFAMYEGYIYKRLRTLKNEEVYKWICANHLTARCEGVLTTKKYKVLVTSQHKCRNEGNEKDGKGLFDYHVNNNRTIDTAHLTGLPVVKENEKDDVTATVANTKRKTKNVRKGSSSVGEVVPSKKIKLYKNIRKSKRSKDDDLKAQIPAVIIDQMPGTAKEDNQIKDTNKEKASTLKEVNKQSETIELQCGRVSEEDDIFVEQVSNESNNSVELIEENEHPNLLLKEYIGEIIESDYQYDNDYHQLEVYSKEDGNKLPVSTANKEHLECTYENFEAEAIYPLEEEEMETDFADYAENVSIALSRGPNGEYFVHVKNTSDTNDPNAL